MIFIVRVRTPGSCTFQQSLIFVIITRYYRAILVIKMVLYPMSYRKKQGFHQNKKSVYGQSSWNNDAYFSG